mmetsp:Transcript_38376/g.90591  ORF Transcript_38376/g.90591 Transcript_38376/m.90591 type:complete len:229 (-) Transcript_38376:1772-2458(-)
MHALAVDLDELEGLGFEGLRPDHFDALPGPDLSDPRLAAVELLEAERVVREVDDLVRDHLGGLPEAQRVGRHVALEQRDRLGEDHPLVGALQQHRLVAAEDRREDGARVAHVVAVEAREVRRQPAVGHLALGVERAGLPVLQPLGVVVASGPALPHHQRLLQAVLDDQLRREGDDRGAIEGRARGACRHVEQHALVRHGLGHQVSRRLRLLVVVAYEGDRQALCRLLH